MTVFVLGAGASFPAGMPLAADLQSEMADFARRLANQGKQMVPGESYRDVVEELGILQEEGFLDPSADLELGLSRLDLALKPTRDDPAHPVAWHRLNRIRHRTLPHLVEAFLLDRHIHVQRSAGATEYLERFVNQFVRPGDTIITFNYDCLMELILYSRGLWTLNGGYGVRVSEAYPRIAGIRESPCIVLKLHGSIGWLSRVDPIGSLIIVLNGVLFERIFQMVLPPYAGGAIPVRPVMELPSYTKGLSSYPLPFIWSLAAEKLRTANRILITGYSFPEADSAARTLFFASVQPGKTVEYFWLGSGTELGRVRSLAEAFQQVGIVFHDRCARIEELAEGFCS